MKQWQVGPLPVARWTHTSLTTFENVLEISLFEFAGSISEILMVLADGKAEGELAHMII